MDCTNTHPMKEIEDASGDSNDQESRSGLNHFLELPEDVIANILRRLGTYEILKNAQRVCSSWRNICKDPSMWHSIDMSNLGYFECCVAMCRLAVDWSEGQLTELCIDHFATRDLLEYISERSSKLKYLKIRGYNGLDQHLIEAVKQFPLLEELHFVCSCGIFGSIDLTGVSLKLKSFTLSSSEYQHRHSQLYEDEENIAAVAIAESMPGLLHLRLVGNNMTNAGLQAILDGCPMLEYLDIRRCFNVYLHGEIGDRIAQKIKDFKAPNDLMEDCDWDADVFYDDDDYSDDDYPYYEYEGDHMPY